MDTRVGEKVADYVANLSTRNPTSTALEVACTELTPNMLPIVGEVPFFSARKWSALSVDNSTGRSTYVLGAPDVLQSCGHPTANLQKVVEAEMARGLRVLLFASSAHPLQVDDESGEPSLPADLIPLGIVCLRDELRSQVGETLSSFTRAAIQLKILSGDHSQTAATLAQ